MRLIDADALIGELHNTIFEDGEDRANVYRVIQGRPTISAQPEQGWIPVTERLPDKAGRYLVTCFKWGEYEVDWNIFHTEPKPFWLWEQGVTAWMPLPEPYKGDRNEIDRR